MLRAVGAKPTLAVDGFWPRRAGARTTFGAPNLTFASSRTRKLEAQRLGPLVAESRWPRTSASLMRRQRLGCLFVRQLPATFKDC